MVITLDKELEEAIQVEARKRGMAPDALAIDALRIRFLRPVEPIIPRDDWERRLLEIGTDCGASLPDSALTSEEMYD